MKRLTFLAGLLGLPLLGQKRKPDIDQRYDRVLPSAPLDGDLRLWYDDIDKSYHIALNGREIHWFSGSGKALSGQCPVCGTMAKPVKAYVDLDGEVKLENLVRCKRCNSAFWQDSED